MCLQVAVRFTLRRPPPSGFGTKASDSRLGPECQLCRTKSNSGGSGKGGREEPQRTDAPAAFAGQWRHLLVVAGSGRLGQTPPASSTCSGVGPALIPSAPGRCPPWDRAPSSPASSPPAARPGSSALRGNKPARCQGPAGHTSDSSLPPPGIPVHPGYPPGLPGEQRSCLRLRLADLGNLEPVQKNSPSQPGDREVLCFMLSPEIRLLVPKARSISPPSGQIRGSQDMSQMADLHG